ncbi:MAG: hypothetical protein JWQ25_1142 [Daejeonella sp.]|nr:hypothetical protein [Daejeonella sp.]
MNQETWNAITDRTYDLEFDWFGVDKLGAISMFSSFNRGFIPSKAISSIEKYTELEKLIKELPKITTAKLYTKSDGDFSDWILYSEKGLFSFDYQDAHRETKVNRYDLIAEPQNPLHVYDIQNLNLFMSILPQFDLVFSEDLTFEKLEQSLIETFP